MASASVRIPSRGGARMADIIPFRPPPNIPPAPLLELVDELPAIGELHRLVEALRVAAEMERLLEIGHRPDGMIGEAAGGQRSWSELPLARFRTTAICPPVITVSSDGKLASSSPQWNDLPAPSAALKRSLRVAESQTRR